jgi:hypothetical protein
MERLLKNKRMQHSFFYLLILCFTVLTSSSNAQQKFLLEPTWAKNNKIKLEIEHHFETKSKNDSAKFDVELRVKEKNEAGFLLEWTYISFYNVNLNDPYFFCLTQILEGLSIEYTTDPKGQFLQIEKHDLLRLQVGNKIDKLIELLHTRGEDYRLAIDKIMKQFSDKHFLENSLLSEISIYHRFYGKELIEGLIYTEDYEVEGLFLGKSLPVKTRTAIDFIDTDNHSISMRQKTETDNEVITKIIKDIIREKLREQGKEDVELTYFDSVEFSEELLCEMDTKRTFPTMLIYTKLFSHGTKESKESYVYKELK